MINCSGVKTPAEAEEFIEVQYAQLEKIAKLVHFPAYGEGMRAEGSEFERYCREWEAIQAAKRYLIKKGLIYEESESFGA